MMNREKIGILIFFIGNIFLNINTNIICGIIGSFLLTYGLYLLFKKEE